MSVITMKTPGVYVKELDAFGNAVVPVPTAIPAFIGYTGETSYNGKNLVNKAVKVSSLAEFSAIFGSTPPQIEFSLTDLTPAASVSSNEGAANDPKKVPKKVSSTAGGANAPVQPKPDFVLPKGGDGYTIDTTTVNYRLYSAVQFFYENGGGTCYIVSTGAYDYSATGLTATKPFTDGLAVLVKESEPTMIIIPDAVELADTSQSDLATIYALCYTLQGEVINHCGSLKNRVALLDIPRGYSEPLVGTTSVEGFRNNVEPTLPKYNSYAAVYYPWLHTTVNQLADISYKNIAEASQATVKLMLNLEFLQVNDPVTKALVDNPMKKYIDALFPVSSTVSDGAADLAGAVPKAGSKANTPKVKSGSTPTAQPITQDKADSVLKNLSKNYKLILNHLLEKLNLMPPSAAMAGIYTTVDNNEGVWVAPANVGVQAVVSPAIKIDLQAQEDLNVPLDGKSVCAIRSFPGKGVLVWGARTLDGNSNDWRYINVRRTLIYIEQSVKEAASAYVFAPNDASTWVSVKSMISNFLIGLWNQGGLVGPKPAEAFSVTVGLGSTMTGDDILQGRMIVAVKVAVSHPAEFIEITFQQEMQKG